MHIASRPPQLLVATCRYSLLHLFSSVAPLLFCCTSSPLLHLFSSVAPLLFCCTSSLLLHLFSSTLHHAVRVSDRVWACQVGRGRQRMGVWSRTAPCGTDRCAITGAALIFKFRLFILLYASYSAYSYCAITALRFRRITHIPICIIFRHNDAANQPIFTIRMNAKATVCARAARPLFELGKGQLQFVSDCLFAVRE